MAVAGERRAQFHHISPIRHVSRQPDGHQGVVVLSDTTLGDHLPFLVADAQRAELWLQPFAEPVLQPRGRALQHRAIFRDGPHDVAMRVNRLPRPGEHHHQQQSQQPAALFLVHTPI